jgi:hypothetical protein
MYPERFLPAVAAFDRPDILVDLGHRKNARHALTVLAVEANCAQR